jgi:AcrR family transcriptional regulator
MASTKRKATGERRLEIVQAARDILISEGFHKLTLRNVANRVGIKLASLQYHYKNKAALIGAVVEKASEYELYRARNLLKIEPGGDPRLQIDQAIRSALDDHKAKEENQLFNQMMAMAIEEPAAQELIDDYYHELWAIWSDLLLKFNPSLEEEERLNRSAQVVSLVDGSSFLIDNPLLCGKLPDSYYDHIVNSVIKLVFE